MFRKVCINLFNMVKNSINYNYHLIYKVLLLSPNYIYQLTVYIRDQIKKIHWDRILH